MNETIDAIEAAYGEYHFNLVAQNLYNFIWSDYCDWFVEAAKTDIFSEHEAKKKAALVVMDIVLSAILRLLHPFMPYVTEELWCLMAFGEDSIQFTRPPKKLRVDDRHKEWARRAVLTVYDVVEKIRNVRADSGIPSTEKIRVRIDSEDPVLRAEARVIARLTNAEEVIIEKSRGYSGYSGYSAAGLILVERAHLDKRTECERLDRQIAEAETQLEATQRKLSNKSFVERAPAEVVEEHRQRESNFTAEVAKLKQARESPELDSFSYVLHR